MATEVTPNKNYQLPSGGNHLSTDITRIRNAFTKIDADMVAAEQMANIRYQEVQKNTESVRRAKLNAMLGENVLPL
tara:strand:+ start:507 stop:734 length:228 start_codon:yes stop_codon:yes gene_type:complete